MRREVTVSMHVRALSHVTMLIKLINARKALAKDEKDENFQVFHLGVTL